MKSIKQLLKRATSAFLALVLALSLVPVSVWATVDYDEETLTFGNSEKTTLVYDCPSCGYFKRIINIEWGEDPNPDLFDNFFCDECGLCFDCAEKETHCRGCGTCTAGDSGDFCEECHRCRSCWTEETHCPNCHEHDTERCDQCSWNMCYDCHDQHNAWCPFCGSCLYAAFDSGEVCYSGGGHCTDCCVVCEDCELCFAIASKEVDPGEFCGNCGLCMECAIEDKLHCPECHTCFSDSSCCDASGLCYDCCREHGNHCPECDDHVGQDGDWCPTDPDVHCLKCAEKDPGICEICGECMKCAELEKCEDCGFCEDCCLEFSEEAGCGCGLCVENADFEDPEHCCAGCGEAFSCVEEFCEYCGLCMDCCLSASEDAGCVCGICVESPDFEDDSEHMCSNCGGFTCVNGELCDYCGYCEVCCLAESEQAGCVCGICVEDAAFHEPDHLCERCETALSCMTWFCGDCGYCEDCCKFETMQMGCLHDICIESSAWSEHYCEDCGRCKDECDCGQDCCEVSEYSYERSASYIMGSIISQPRNVGGYVSNGSNDDYLHQNQVTFSVQVFGDPNELYYQWYRKDGAYGTPERLTDEAAGDEEYWGRNDAITSGATAQTLKTYIPADACVKEYHYFCEITDRDGNLLSTTREAKLTARHRYEWVPTDGGHIYRCVGCGALGKFADEVREHEFTERRILAYPTETESGLLGNRCQICGYETGEVIPPLGKHDKHIFQYYSTSREHWCECVCGKQINARSEHSWGDWILDKAATENSKGSKHHICLVCHYREDTKLQKKRHAHGSFYSGDEYDHSFRQMNPRQHGRVCDDPECGQYYDIEAHTFTEWEITQFPDWYTDGSMQRVCTGCGYKQVKKIGKWGSDRKRILVVEHGKSTKTTSLCAWDDTPTLTAEERPGYVFSGWTCDFCYHIKADGLLHVKNVALLDPNQYAYQGKTDVIKVDDPTAEVMTILNIPQVLKNLALPHELKNEDECYFAFTANYTRIPVRVMVWPENSNRLQDRIMIEPGNGYDCKTGSVRSERLGTHLFLEEIETGESGVSFPYEYVLHMNGYEGGPIKILSPDMDYSLNCGVAVSIEDCESVIRSKAGVGYGIEVNSLNGGEFTMYSENGGKLTIDVEDGKGLDNSGIQVVDAVGRTSTFLNHANLDISVANLSKPNPRMIDNSAAGIRAGDVRIWGGDISIDVHAPHLANELAAVGVEANGAVDIDSPALRIDVTDVDSGAGGTGAGINARGVEISMLTAKHASDWYEDEESIELLGEDEDMDSYAAGVFVNYPDGGFAVKLPSEDPAGMAAITTYGENETGGKTFAHCLGYTVQIDYDPDKLTLSPVGRVYVDEAGRFCVPAGETLEFVAAAEPGYRGNNIGLYRDGKTYLLPDIDENENRRYRIESVTECMVLELGGVQSVEPFATEPFPFAQTVLGGGLGTAAVAWEMNPYEVGKLYRKNGGSQSANGVLERHDAGDVMKTDTAYSAGVWLQSYSSATDRWINRPELGTFQTSLHAFAEFTETRQYSRPGTTTRYRLAVLFDGIHYYSEPFEVTWTADEAEASSRIASAVELYMADAWNANGTNVFYKDGGAWLRLDARCSDIYYDVQNGLYVNSFSRSKKQPTEEDGYIRFAHFDASRGVLTLDGGKNGSWNGVAYDTTYAVLREIRTAEDSCGDLTVYAAGSCTITQDTASVGWLDRWGNGNLVHYADNAAILNDTGSVILTAAEGAYVSVEATGPYDMVREERENGSYFYTGERISAVRASGDIRVSGPFSLTVNADCNKDWEEKPGYYGCAVGLDAKGDILVGGETFLRIDAGIFSANGAGAAQAMAAEGSIRMEDDCSVMIWTNSVRSPSLACNDLGSIWAEKTVTVKDHASLDVSARGAELCAVYAAEGAYICSDRAARIVAIPLSEEDASWAIDAPRTVVNGFHSFTWRDPDCLSPTSGELSMGDMNTYVSYLSEPAGWDGSRTFIVMDGKPRRLEPITQGLSADKMQIEIYRNGSTAEVFGSEFQVCPGDIVTLYPPEGLPGCSFDRWGWPHYEPRDVKELDGGAIRFTMPDWDVTPIAEFDAGIISLFDFALDGSDPAMTADHRIGKADVSFRVELPAEFAPGTRLEAYAVLECTYLNEEGELVWCDRETEPANRYSYLEHDAVAYDQGKKTASFNVSDTVYLADIVPTELTPGDWKRIYESPDRSYRLRIMLYTVETVGGRDRYNEWCTWVTNPFELSWNKPFTVDVDGAGRNPEIVIPSGDVGTAFAIDFSKYVNGGSGSYHYSIIPAVQPVPMEFTFNEDRGSFCFFHTESSVGMNYADNLMQIQDKLTGEMALVYFDVMPTLNTQMYDTYVGGVRVSAYNRADVLGDGRVSYTPAEGGKPAKLTLSGVTLDAGFCGSRNPAVYGDNAFAAVFTREDLEIVAEGSNRIVLDENSEAGGDPYVQDSLIAGIYGFGANVTLSGGGELNIQSHRGFCLEEDEGQRGGSFTLNDCGLTLDVTRGNVLGKSGSKGFIYADGRFTARSAQDSDATLLNGVGFADGARENAVLLLSAGTDMENAQPGSPDMLAAQQPESLYHFIRIQSTGRTEDAPIADGLVSEPSGEVYVVANESAKGAGVMKAIVAVYEKDTGRFLKLWVGELDPAEPLTATGLTVDESNSCRIMVLDGDTWRPLTGSKDF